MDDPRRVDLPGLAGPLLAWYRTSRRDLPWRRTRDPYAIWVSEVMLQQTRVAVVVPYWQRWMERFPTADALARAPLDDVLSCWSGLGYYSRARNLHAGAREAVARFGGALPDSAGELRSLPGIGRYTAGAIASIAFGRREPVVDGNVARVLARVLAIEENVKAAATQRRLWQAAAELVPAARPGDFNQALMELGATVCTPTPRCSECPIAGACLARATGRERALPVMAARPADQDKPLLRTAAAWAEKGGRLLLGRRRPEGLFGGLWELPQATTVADLTAHLAGVGLTLTVERRPVVRHRQVLSHRRLLIDVHRAEATGRTPRGAADPYDRLAWHGLASVADLGLAAGTRAIVLRYQERTGWTETRRPSRSSSRATTRSSRG